MFHRHICTRGTIVELWEEFLQDTCKIDLHEYIFAYVKKETAHRTHVCTPGKKGPGLVVSLSYLAR
jgi:hypothetical protein